MAPGETEFFAASYDSTTKVISTAVFVLLISITFATRSTMVVCGGAALFFLAYAFSPRGYAISERTLLIRRLIGNARIPLVDLQVARPAGEDDLSGCIRLFGSGGLFGWYGLFRTSKLGRCTWYVTNRRHAIVLVSGEKTAIISPDDLDRFLDSVRAITLIPSDNPVKEWSSGAA